MQDYLGLLTTGSIGEATFLFASGFLSFYISLSLLAWLIFYSYEKPAAERKSAEQYYNEIAERYGEKWYMWVYWPRHVPYSLWLSKEEYRRKLYIYASLMMPASSAFYYDQVLLGFIFLVIAMIYGISMGARPSTD